MSAATAHGEREGVIKYDLVHTQRAHGQAARSAELIAALVAWRDILARLSLVGQDPQRYAGIGFGNVSARVAPWTGTAGARPFLVTGSQTGALACVSADDLVLVERWNVAQNRLEGIGLRPPSSESLTHAALYDQSPAVRWIFHVHGALLWRAALDGVLGPVPTTRASVAYGTPEMAREIGRLWRGSTLPERRLLVMAGHEDGLLAFGRTAEEAGRAIVEPLAQALAARFLHEGRLCRRGRG